MAQCTPLADLAAQARQLDHASRQIVPLLPEPLRQHVAFACLRNDRLLLVVDSAAWATRARMHQGPILAAVHSLGWAASCLATRVLPPSAAATDATAGAMSPRRDAETIRTAAKAIADPELHALFLQLAAGADGQAQD